MWLHVTWPRTSEAEAGTLRLIAEFYDIDNQDVLFFQGIVSFLPLLLSSIPCSLIFDIDPWKTSPNTQQDHIQVNSTEEVEPNRAKNGTRVDGLRGSLEPGDLPRQYNRRYPGTSSQPRLLQPRLRPHQLSRVHSLFLTLASDWHLYKVLDLRSHGHEKHDE